MDKDLLEQVKKSSKKTTKNKAVSKKKTLLNPVKVVYISSPMKIKTSASNFRALVQELTGRDSDFPPDPTKFTEEEEEDESFSTAQIEGGANDDHLQVVSSESTTCSSPSNYTNNIDGDRNINSKKKNGFEMFDEDDDVFMPQMMEGFSGIFSSALWYESPHQAV